MNESIGTVLVAKGLAEIKTPFGRSNQLKLEVSLRGGYLRRYQYVGERLLQQSIDTTAVVWFQ